MWKVFGENPSAFMARHNGTPSDEAFSEEGYIGAVRDVSFDVHSGEILIIMGLSGSGKSTVIRCITRLNDPTTGTINFEGENLLAADEQRMIDIRRHKAREDKAREMVELVGLGGRESYFPRELSGGQQQRVGIARSLAVEPDVWFLDEPFSALDPLIRSEMQDEFIRLQRLLKKTIVFITHDFEEATKLADPADDYVAEFARNAPRDRIVSVGAIMDAKKGRTEKSGTGVLQSAKIGEVAEQVLNSAKSVSVLDGNNAVVGTVSRERMTKALFSKEAI